MTRPYERLTDDQLKRRINDCEEAISDGCDSWRELRSIQAQIDAYELELARRAEGGGA